MTPGDPLQINKQQMGNSQECNSIYVRFQTWPKLKLIFCGTGSEWKYGGSVHRQWIGNRVGAAIHVYIKTAPLS